MEVQRCVVLMVGLPAAGKSTVAREIAGKMGGRCEVIEFDKIEREINKGEVFDPELWCQARDQAMKRAVESLKVVNYVILDDNFYYRSMRKPYYQLAREHSYGYLELHLTISLEDALARNKERTTHQVPSHVILSMSGKLEATLYPSHAYFYADNDLEALLLALKQSQIPVSQEQPTQPQDTQTFLDSVDQHLRKALSSLLQEQPEMRKEAKRVNEVRIQVLQAVARRQGGGGAVRVSREAWEEIISMNEEDCLQKIESVFRNEVKMSKSV